MCHSSSASCLCKQVALAPAKAARRGLQEAAASAAVAPAAAANEMEAAQLPPPLEIDRSMRALEAAEAEQQVAAAKPGPLALTLTVEDFAILVPLHST